MAISMFWSILQVMATLLKEAQEEDEPIMKTPKRAPLAGKKGESKKKAKKLFGEGTSGDAHDDESEGDDQIELEVAALR